MNENKNTTIVTWRMRRREIRRSDSDFIDALRECLGLDPLKMEGGITGIRRRNEPQRRSEAWKSCATEMTEND